MNAPEFGKSNASSENSQKIMEFLHALYGDCSQGYLVLWTKQDKHTKCFPLSDLENSIRYALEEALTKDVYFGVGLQGEVPPPGSRGSTNTVSVIPGLWLDIDIAGANHKEINLPQTMEDAEKLINSFPLSPTIIVKTAGGLHCYYLFREPWILNSEQEREAAQSLSKRFQLAIISQAKSFGWKLDNTSDLARVLRVPYTYNRKQDEPVQVTIDKFDDCLRYAPSDFEDCLPKEEPVKKMIPPVKREFACESKAEEDYPQPKLEPIIQTCPFMRHCKEDAATLQEPEWWCMLTIACLCEDGEKKAHEISADYPSYSYEETEAKIDHVRKSGKPITCEYINDNFGDTTGDGSLHTFCENCPHWGKIKSPIALGLPRRLKYSELSTEDAKRIVAESIQKVKEGDPGAHLEAESLSALAWLEANELADYARIKAELKTLGISMADLNKAIKSEHKREEFIQNQRAHEDDDKQKLLAEMGLTREGNSERYRLNANIFAKYVLNKMTLLVTSGECFYEYAGRAWRKMDDLVLKKNLRVMLHEAEDDIWNSAWEAEYMLALQREAGVKKELNQNKQFLNLENGMLDTRTFELHEHHQEFYSSVEIPIAYDAKAEAPRFMQFLGEITGNDENLMWAILEMMGYCLTPETEAQTAFILYGQGSNGKSVLTNTLTKLCGQENVSNVPLTEFDKSFNRLSLVGKTLNISSENELNGKSFNTQHFKAIVAGDPIMVEPKYKEAFSYRPFTKLLSSTNNLPKTSDLSQGFYRRLLILPFNYSFEGKNQNKFLENELEAELPGILNLALSGLKRLREQGYVFTESLGMKDILSEYKAEQDPIFCFFQGCIQPASQQERVERNILKKFFKDWCYANGHQELVRMSSEKFWLEFKRVSSVAGLSIDFQKSNGSHFVRGISLVKTVGNCMHQGSVSAFVPNEGTESSHIEDLSSDCEENLSPLVTTVATRMTENLVPFVVKAMTPNGWNAYTIQIDSEEFYKLDERGQVLALIDEYQAMEYLKENIS